MTNQPRILQVSNHYLQPGGEEESVRRIAQQASAIAEVECCTFDSRQWTGAAAPSLFRQAAWMIRNPSSIARLEEADARFRPDAWLVHNVFPVASAEVYELARRLGRPVIQYLHNYRPLSISGYSWAGGGVTARSIPGTYLREILAGSWQRSRLRTAWFSVVLSRMRASPGYRSIRSWVAISDFVRSRFVEAGFPSEKVFTVRHSWELRNEQTPPAEDRGYYLFLGRLVEQKGLQTLLDAWALLEQRMGPATPVLSICGQGPLEPAVRSACAASRAIRFHGQVSGTAKDSLIRGARAMIAPSLWWEPLGLVTYEAYDYGKPMLAARSGGLTETVEHGCTGFLHHPGDARELAGQVAALEADARMVQSMGRAGREWLVQHTAPDLWQSRFEEVLRRSIHQPVERPAAVLAAQPA